MALIRNCLADDKGIIVYSNDGRMQQFDVFGHGPKQHIEQRRLLCLFKFNGLYKITDTDQLLGKTFLEINL
jgi:hypothetical protein